MFMARDIDGRNVEVPESAAEDIPYFDFYEPDWEGFISYYQKNGYVVLRNAVLPEICDQANAAFDREVSPSREMIQRQNPGYPQRHQKDSRGYMMNPILNVQSMDPASFPRFRFLALNVLTARGVKDGCSKLFGESGKLVQSMFFEGNLGTRPHHDTYYLDSTDQGRMVASWIAMEDIAPGAGRFFVCPGSHEIDLAKNGGDFGMAFNHGKYHKLISDIIANRPLKISAPALRKGDVLFWSSNLIHGSLKTTQPEFSRRSFTAHWIPESTDLLQFQTRVRKLDCDTVNGVPVARPKDFARLNNRVVAKLQGHFPKAYTLAKRLVIKALLR